MNSDTLNQRIARLLPPGQRANCHGTAFFLAGIIPVDSYVEAEDAQVELKSSFTKVTRPVAGAIVTFEYFMAFPDGSSPKWSLEHMGFLYNNPLTMIHRIDVREKVEDVSLSSYLQTGFFTLPRNRPSDRFVANPVRIMYHVKN